MLSGYLWGMGLKSNSCRRDPGVTADLELRALEKLARALCDHTQQLAADARSRGVLRSREAGLQTEVFDERRRQIMQVLDTDSPEVAEPRMARLEKLIEAVSFSRDYFMNV